jgi:hypothetical protein
MKNGYTNILLSLDKIEGFSSGIKCINLISWLINQ